MKRIHKILVGLAVCVVAVGVFVGYNFYKGDTLECSPEKGEEAFYNYFTREELTKDKFQYAMWYRYNKDGENAFLPSDVKVGEIRELDCGIVYSFCRIEKSGYEKDGLILPMIFVDMTYKNTRTDGRVIVYNYTNIEDGFDEASGKVYALWRERSFGGDEFDGEAFRYKLQPGLYHIYMGNRLSEDSGANYAIYYVHNTDVVKYYRLCRYVNGEIELIGDEIEITKSGTIIEQEIHVTLSQQDMFIEFYDKNHEYLTRG